MLQSIDDKILASLRAKGRGTIFFAQDMLQFGQRTSVLKALDRMVEAGAILRIARGIFCFPKIERIIGLGVIFPTLDEIAQAVV